MSLANDVVKEGDRAMHAHSEDGAAGGSLADRIAEQTVAHDAAGADARLAEIIEAARAAGHAEALAALLARPAVRGLVRGILGCSPYLASLMLTQPARLTRSLDAPPEERIGALIEDARAAADKAQSVAELMAALRRMKSEAAVLIALADIGGVWPVMQVTRALSEVADAAIGTSLRFLLREAARRGQFTPADPAAPEQGSGYFVLGMGKYGAFELNYSSDVDLIVFYEGGLARLAERTEPQAFFVRLTRDLVRMLQERTGDGYVFRADLRLRPDPGATPVALSTNSALGYYESFGQNWERAAMIKARVVAGDVAAGTRFLKELTPYVWRKYLDFAAIADVHAMKRQIHAVKGFGEIAVDGHDIKLGRGGIREIEFFAQTQQLIAGGRQADLRVSGTLAALAALLARGWIGETVRAELERAYLYLRRIEHRLQMIADEQTHRLPEEPDKLDRLAHFAGYATRAELAAELRGHLERVQGHYAALFEDVPELTQGTGNLVFAGAVDDPQTVETLKRMGFSDPATIIATVRGWHHGRYPAVRSARARERLTEVQPLLVEALSRTADPDLAFVSFDRFLSQLPTGVQLFSLLRTNPRLLGLIADIMGTAPRLARILSRRRRVLDAVLDPRFFGMLPSDADLERLIAAELDSTPDYQEKLDRARVVGNEQGFLIGVRLLTGTISATQAGGGYARLAEHLIAALQREAEQELARAHGAVAGGGAAVLGMGKLGGREMTASSDLDLIVVYDFEGEDTISGGVKPLAGSQFYGRLTQRLVSALAAPTAEGQLYEVDMRLRPSGQKGPVATRLEGFVDYQSNEAWTWEHMALTRARVLTGPPAFRAAIEQAIRDVLTRPRDRAKIAADVRDMRERIAKEKGTGDIWDLKQVRGGLVDLEFIAQHLQLIHAHTHPGVLDQNTKGALVKQAEAGLLRPGHAEVLIPAAELVNNLTQILRLCFEGPFTPDKAPDGMKMLLARAGECPDFGHLEAHLRETLAEVAPLFDEIVA
jgi:glutamate-ammonia-ligase adenylyltransferase